MNKPKSREIIEKLEKGEKVMCPKCNHELLFKGHPSKITYVYCSNSECNGKIVIN